LRLSCCRCVCVRDVFNEVSTRLVRQAHLYDRFPQTTSRLSCLRATVPAHGYKYGDSHVSISHCDATRPEVRQVRLGRRIQSMTDINRYVRQYRGTQPHSTESTMTNKVEVSQRQSASGSIRQYVVKNNIKTNCRSLPVKNQHQAVTSSNNQCTVRYNANNKNCRSLPVKNTHPLGARFPTASSKLRHTKVPKPSTYRRRR